MRLERLAGRASASLRVEEGLTFTAAHRRLWAEFTGRVALPANVRELFARTEAVLSQAPGLSLLNAWGANGHLAACLLLDSAPRRFLSTASAPTPASTTRRTPRTCFSWR